MLLSFQWLVKLSQTDLQMNYIHLLCCSCKSSITLYPAFLYFPDFLNFMPGCEPNHLDADYQEPKQVCIKEPSNFTGTSNALSKRSAPSWASDRLHAVEASCSKPRQDCGGSLRLPSPRCPRQWRSGRRSQRSGLSAPRARPPLPLRSAPGTRTRVRPARAAPAGAATGIAAPGEIFQSTPPKAWP